MAKFLDYTGLESLWAKIKALIPTNNSQLTNGAGYINNEYMGCYVRGDNALYVPKDFLYDVGASHYTFYIPFVVRASDTTTIYSTTYFREVGTTTNIRQLGSVRLDRSGSYGTSVSLNPKNLYLLRMSDGTSDIYTVCNLTDLNTALASKQTAPSTAGTAGQVLVLDSNLAPVWTTPSASAPPEVYVGSDTPSGYSLYIDPDGMLTSGEGVSF